MVSAWPVVEVFGPTIQGEGPLAGVPTHFVRFAGCDYRCAWCDSMHAVDPARWKGTPRLVADQIVDRVEELGAGARWVTLSGGNPALYDLESLTIRLEARAFAVAVETQGSRWSRWLRIVDKLVCSPKPPSSGMVERTDRHVDAFLTNAIAAGMLAGNPRLAVKVVVADEADLRWARRFVTGTYRKVPFYLSVCSPVPGYDWPWDDEGGLRLEVARRYAWLAERVTAEPAFARAVVLPQLHVIAWGSKVGV
jgi:7-carboxy-7-deazaguanine synthase